VTKKVAIFGAGITGLVAARELARAGHEVDVYEAEDHVGGLAATFRSDDGFRYDNGPHFIFSTLAEKFGIADQCDPVKYYEDLFVRGRYYQFPFGFAQNPVYALSAGLATLTRAFHRRPENLREFLTTYYGRVFSREVLTPLIEKWAGLPAAEVSLDFAHRLLPTNVGYILYSLLKKLRGGVTEDYYRKGRYIVYPRGTNEVIFNNLGSTPGVRIHLQTPLTSLKAGGREVTGGTAGSRSISADYYLSTIPLPALWRALGAPKDLAGWNDLRYRGVLILFIKVSRDRLIRHLWSWFPEDRHRFYRISEFKNALATMAPSGQTMIAVEIGCQSDDPFWGATAEEIYAVIAKDLADLYQVRHEEILGLDLRRSPYAYPVLRKSTEQLQRALRHPTPFTNLFIAGRTGMFQYRMMEGCYESAVTCVGAMQAAMEGKTVAPMPVEVDTYGRPKMVPE
jgi:protoporphyrinogen oxidase